MRQPDLDAKLWVAVERLAQGRRAHLQSMATRLGLSPLQLTLLSTLGLGPATAATLAAELDVRASTVADAVAALRRKQLVTEDVDPNDRRRRLLRPTEAGLDVAAESELGDRVAQDTLGTLDSQDKAAALEVLLTLIGGLHRAGVIAIDRSCLTCRFRQATDLGPGFCMLLETPLQPETLRVDCPEHQAAG
jgi:DNA-binding MarR family transcriptional regulator